MKMNTTKVWYAFRHVGIANSAESVDPQYGTAVDAYKSFLEKTRDASMAQCFTMCLARSRDECIKQLIRTPYHNGAGPVKDALESLFSEEELADTVSNWSTES